MTMQKAIQSIIQEEQVDSLVAKSPWRAGIARDLGTSGRFLDKGKIHFWGFLSVFYLFPALVFWASNSPHIVNYVIFGAIVALLLFYIRTCRFTLRELGIRRDTLKGNLLWSGLISLGLSALIYLIYLGQWFRQAQLILVTPAFLFFYILIASPAQEFVYRGLLFAEMKRRGLHQPWLQIMVSSFSFAFLHIFHYDYLTFFVTFIVGLAWSILYQKSPNLLGVTLSHLVLGILAILTHLV
jgi:membrane protease YdiL (CAAX protease family)